MTQLLLFCFHDHSFSILWDHKLRLPWLQKFNKNQIFILVASIQPQSNKWHYVSEMVIRKHS